MYIAYPVQRENSINPGNGSEGLLAHKDSYPDLIHISSLIKLINIHETMRCVEWPFVSSAALIKDYPSQNLLYSILNIRFCLFSVCCVRLLASISLNCNDMIFNVQC